MIKGYIGLLGEGKTLSMVFDAVEALKQGKRVISNTPIHSTIKGKELFAVCLPQHGIEEALKTETNALFCIDEASIVFPSWFWAKLSGDFLIRFAQARKFGLDIFYTSQGYNHTIKRLRDLTNIVTKCSKHTFFGQTFFRNLDYDPEYFAYKIINGTSMEKKFILRRRFIYPWQAKQIYKAFDTYALVQASALMGDTKDDNFSAPEI